MSEMIERVARAICGRRCLLGRIVNEPCVKADGSNGPCLATRNQLILSGSEDAARAAIEAMREPTQSMINQGYWAMPPTEGYSLPDDVSGVWTAMIGAALSEEKQPA